MNPQLDYFFERSEKWQNEVRKLRTIVLDCGLDEAQKWGQPCYTSEGKNIVLIHEFKEYCAFLFFKGAVLRDPKKILIRQTENVQAARQIRFTDVKEIIRQEKTLKAYIDEAIEVEKAGLKVKMKKSSEFKMAEEFKVQLDKMPKLKTAFEALTPGRQRAYLLFFSSAKQAATREARVKKLIPDILKGRGLND